MVAVNFFCRDRHWQVYSSLGLHMGIVTLLALALGIANVSGQCQPGQTPQEAGLKFPDILSQSFKADLAGVSVTENAALALQEHYSVETGRGSVHNEGPGDNYSFYLTENDTIRALGDNTGCFKLRSTPSTVSLLIEITRKALNVKNVSFIENTELAGIPVNHWRVCYPYVEGGDDSNNRISSINIFIVSDSSWEMFTGKENALLRISLELFLDNVMQERFLLDFLNFESKQYDSNIFQADLEPPLGVPCLDLRQDMTQPKVPFSASFRREIISRTGAQSYISDSESVVIDEEKQVIQRQTSVATSIRDFNHGATYLILRIKGHSTSCRTMPVNKLQTIFWKDETDPGFTFKDHYASMDSVSDYLYLSGDFTFSGEHQYRGIPCQVFTHITHNYAGERQRAVILLYFSKPGFLIEDRDGISENKLVKIEFRLEDYASVSYNIYLMNEFDFDEALVAPFDISPCFDENHHIEFKLELEEQQRNKQTALTANGRRALEHEVRKIIAELSKLDFVRVQIGTAVERRGTVSLTGKLFARPDSGVHFEHLQDKSFGSDSKAVALTVSVRQGVTNIDNCAEQAVSDPTISDADYCFSAKLCILYRAANSSEKSLALTDDKGCSHLTKIRGFSDLVSMYTAWNILEEKISKDKMLIELTVEEKTFVFTGIRRINDPNSQLHKISPLNSFEKAAYDKITTSESQKVSGKLRLKECADSCLNNLVFPCEAFSYCIDPSSCELHGAYQRKEMKEKPNSDRAPGYITTRDCQTYVRSFLHNFERQPGTVAKMIRSSSDTEIKDIENEEKCAELCMERRDFQCESFSFCSPDGLKGNCVLSKHHWRRQDFTQKVTGKSELDCVQFSRNYFWDYTKTEGITSFAVRTSVVSAGGAETCAFECSSSGNCDTFHYCEDGDICQYIDTSEGKPNPEDILPKYHCYTFMQKDLPDVVNRHNNLAGNRKITPDSSGTDGYSSGAMAGLAIAMLVLGVALCFAGLYAWTVYKRRIQDGDSWNTSLQLTVPKSYA